MGKQVIYIPRSKEWIWEWFRKSGEFAGTCVSREVLEVLEEHIHLQDWLRQRVFLPKNLLSEFLEFWGALGASSPIFGTPPQPACRIIWDGTIIALYEVGDVYEAICAQEARKKEFQDLCEKFSMAVSDSPDDGQDGGQDGDSGRDSDSGPLA